MNIPSNPLTSKLPLGAKLVIFIGQWLLAFTMVGWPDWHENVAPRMEALMTEQLRRRYKRLQPIAHQDISP